MKRISIIFITALLLCFANSVFSQSATVTIYYSGAQAWGCCSQCGADFICLGNTGCGCCQSSQQVKNFMDPVPAGNHVTNVHVTYFGADCNTPLVASYLNNIPVCSGGLTFGTTTCACNSCNEMSCDSSSYACGFPNYHYGAVNTLHTIPTSGFDPCFRKVEILFTYAPFNTGSVSGPVTICSGDTAVFSTTPVSGVATYTWTTPLGTVIDTGQGTTSIIVTAGTNSGNVCVSGIDSCGDTISHCIPVTINQTPVVVSTPSTWTICEGDSTLLTACGAVSYSWSPAAGLYQSNACCTMASPSDTTIYTVVGTSDGCTATDQSVVYVLDCSGIPENNDNGEGAKISPNPVYGLSTITWPEKYDELMICDATGRLLKCVSVRGKSSFIVKKNQFERGLYYIRLTRSNGKACTIKMIVAD
jgi:hypothetical protein